MFTLPQQQTNDIPLKNTLQTITGTFHDASITADGNFVALLKTASSTYTVDVYEWDGVDTFVLHTADLPADARVDVLGGFGEQDNILMITNAGSLVLYELVGSSWVIQQTLTTINVPDSCTALHSGYIVYASKSGTNTRFNIFKNTGGTTWVEQAVTTIGTPSGVVQNSLQAFGNRFTVCLVGGFVKPFDWNGAQLVFVPLTQFVNVTNPALWSVFVDRDTILYSIPNLGNPTVGAVDRMVREGAEWNKSYDPTPFVGDVTAHVQDRFDAVLVAGNEVILCDNTTDTGTENEFATLRNRGADPFVINANKTYTFPGHVCGLRAVIKAKKATRVIIIGATLNPSTVYGGDDAILIRDWY